MSHSPHSQATSDSKVSPGTSARTLSNLLTFIGLMGLGALLPIGVHWWQSHEARQVTEIKALGPVKAFDWLGASDGLWLLRTSEGDLIWLKMDRPLLAMASNVRMVMKTVRDGRQWICDETLTQCIAMADVANTVVSNPGQKRSAS